MLNQIQPTDKLYLVVRRDMSPGSQASQLCHALQEFNIEYLTISQAWHGQSNYVCLLSVADELELNELIAAAVKSHIKTSIFREPDMNDTVTAIALEPGEKTKKLCRNLRLAFSEF